MSNPVRTAFVTGANRGLGRETARQLAARGLDVIVSSREAAAARETAAAIASAAAPPAAVTALPVSLDVADPATIAAAAAALEGARIDILVNNAGIAMDGFDAEVARRTIETNYFGPLRVTEALLPLMPAGGTIVMVSSGVGALASLEARVAARFTDPNLTRDEVSALAQEFVADVAAGRHSARGWPSSAYQISKVALNALVRAWAPELRAREIIINAVCPGWVRTDMGGRNASRSVETGAASIVWAALREGDPTGGFFRDGRPIAW